MRRPGGCHQVDKLHLSRSATVRAFRFSLRQKGLVLVCVPLLFQVNFVGLLSPQPARSRHLMPDSIWAQGLDQVDSPGRKRLIVQRRRGCFAIGFFKDLQRDPADIC